MQAYYAITPPGGIGPAGIPPNGVIPFFRGVVYSVAVTGGPATLEDTTTRNTFGWVTDGYQNDILNPLPVAIPGGIMVALDDVLVGSGPGGDAAFAIICAPVPGINGELPT